MPRLVRQPLVALLAALAAMLAPLGATAAGSVAVAARQSVAGATQTTGQAPVGRVTTGRELRDTAVRRVQHGGAEVVGMVTAGSGRAGQGGPGQLPAGALAVAVLAVAVGWWVRRVAPARVAVGRTTGSRCGRGPPALRCA
jgi:hypothetical protein